jgi:hypothetical protein
MGTWIYGDRESFRFCLPQMEVKSPGSFDQIDGPRKAYTVGNGDTCGRQLSSGING